jgi:hypothetical protein
MLQLNRRQFIQGAGGTIAGVSLAQSPPGPAPEPEFGVVPIEFGSGKMVFCDWWFLEAGDGLSFTPSQQRENHYGSTLMPRGIRLRTASPRLSPAPVLVPDTPSDGISMGAYCTLLKDGGKYRIWYESYVAGETNDEEARICYAESDDGYNWKKPNLGIFEDQGSRSNNLVYKRVVRARRHWK